MNLSPSFHSQQRSQLRQYSKLAGLFVLPQTAPHNKFDRDFDTDIESTEPSPEDTPAEPALPTTIRIDLSFIDPLGQGIQGLPYNIKVGDTPHEGVTDAQGTASLDGVEPLQDLEILIKKYDGTWTTKYKGQTACSNMTICAKSPHIKLSVSTEEHKGEAQKSTPPRPLPPIKNDGHIDVRSYDGYLSDFKKKTFPSSTDYELIGVYRKIYDPLPDIRVRAFLKVLREWECHEEDDDSKRYFMLFKPINGSRQFSDTSKHPCEGVREKDTAAGAYQFTLETYRDYIQSYRGIGPGFSPAQQDRLVVARIEGTVKKGTSYAPRYTQPFKQNKNFLLEKSLNL